MLFRSVSQSRYGNAWVYGDAMVYYKAMVLGNAKVYGNAQIDGYATVLGNAKVFGNAFVGGCVRVLGNANVYGYAIVEGITWVCGHAKVYGDSEVHGNNITIREDDEIKDNRSYLVFNNTWSSDRQFIYVLSNHRWHVGCFDGTGEELIKKAYNDSELSGKMYEMYVHFVEQVVKAKQQGIGVR